MDSLDSREGGSGREKVEVRMGRRWIERRRKERRRRGGRREKRKRGGKGGGGSENSVFLGRRGGEGRGQHVPSIFITYFFCDISLISIPSNGLVSQFEVLVSYTIVKLLLFHVIIRDN